MTAFATAATESGDALLPPIPLTCDTGTSALLGPEDDKEEDAPDPAALLGRLAICDMTTSMGSIEIPSVAVMGADWVAVLSKDMSFPDEDAKGDREAVAADFSLKMALALSFDSLEEERRKRRLERRSTIDTSSMTIQGTPSDRIVNKDWFLLSYMPRSCHVLLGQSKWTVAAYPGWKGTVPRRNTTM